MKISMNPSWQAASAAAPSVRTASSVLLPSSVLAGGRALASYVGEQRSTTAPNPSAHGTGLPVAGSTRLRFDDVACGFPAPADAAVPALALRPRGAPV